MVKSVHTKVLRKSSSRVDGGGSKMNVKTGHLMWFIGASVFLISVANLGALRILKEDVSRELRRRRRQQQEQQQQQELGTLPRKLGHVDEQELPEEPVYPLSHFMELSKKEGHDKERLLYLIRDNAGLDYLTDKQYNDLPAWSQVTSMYGSEPRLVGHDQCTVFKSKGDLADKFIGVAGMFNSGTNLLADTLSENCVLKKHQEKYGKKQKGIRWQVPYGKHVPPKDEEFRAHRNNVQIDVNEVLPAIMVRDPFRWLQSICLNYYTSRWPRVYRPTDPRYHCPNLFPTEAEKQKLQERGFKTLKNGDKLVKETKGHTNGQGVFVDKERGPKQQGETMNPFAFAAQEPTTTLTEEELQMHHFPVKIGYGDFTQHHYSLVHMWNEWHQEYVQLQNYPHIFIRFEDLLYFPDEVVTSVCECAGGQLVHRNETTGEALPIKVSVESKKQNHESRVVGKGNLQHTGYLDALIRYGKSATRFKGMTSHDLQYAQHYLDKDLMDIFHYSYPPANAIAQNMVSA